MPSIPADTFLTLDQLNKLFQSLTMTELDLDPTAWNAYLAGVEAGTWDPTDPIPSNPYELVRVSWPSGGAPAFKITDDVAFIRVMEFNDPYNVQRHIENKVFDDDNCNQVTTFTRVIEVNWIFYGPNSFDNAQSLRDGLYYQTNHDIIALQSMYIIPRDITPRRFPELFQGQWWDRTDMTIRFNEKVVRNLEVPYLESVEIIVQKDQPPITETAEVTSTTEVR